MLWKLGRIDGDPVLRETRIRATWEYVCSVEGGVDVDDIEGGRARRREKWERYSCVWM